MVSDAIVVVRQSERTDHSGHSGGGVKRDLSRRTRFSSCRSLRDVNLSRGYVGRRGGEGGDKRGRGVGSLTESQDKQMKSAQDDNVILQGVGTNLRGLGRSSRCACGGGGTVDDHRGRVRRGLCGRDVISLPEGLST